MIHLATFSSPDMNRSRRLCIESALKHGVDSIAGPHYFDPALETRDGFTLEWLKSQPIYEQMGTDWWTQRGCGYWLWKPYIIDLMLGHNMTAPATGWRGGLPDGDFVVYADAGVEFIDNIRYIIDRMDQDVWLFGNNWEHAHWCKADVVEEIIPLSTGNPHLPWRNASLTFGKQAQASVIVFRVSKFSRAFVAEWLNWCVFDGGRLADDSPSSIRNHPEFREHRHDQAILTTLAYREGIKLHYWPAQYNDGAFIYPKLVEYADDNYPILFHHHRRRNHEWENAA